MIGFIAILVTPEIGIPLLVCTTLVFSVSSSFMRKDLGFTWGSIFSSKRRFLRYDLSNRRRQLPQESILPVHKVKPIDTSFIKRSSVYFPVHRKSPPAELPVDLPKWSWWSPKFLFLFLLIPLLIFFFRHFFFSYVLRPIVDGWIFIFTGLFFILLVVFHFFKKRKKDRQKTQCSQS